MPLKSEDYEQIYSLVSAPEDVHIYSRKLRLPTGVLEAVLNLKMVRGVKENYHLLARQSEELLTEWKRGRSILEIAEERDFPPVLTARFLLSAMGFSRARIKRLALSGESSGDGRLDSELAEARARDFMFSRRAHERQHRRATLGEEIIKSWLSDKGVDFLSEDSMLKVAGAKTPDFLVRGLRMLGMRIAWVESKAIFVDEEEHRRYMKKQLSHYIKNFGPGMVVYWYGYVDTILHESKNLLILDYTSFNHPGLEELLDGCPG